MPGCLHRHLVSRLQVPSFLAVGVPLLLAGLLPLRPEVSERWGWSGSWVYPVGDPHVSATSSGDGRSGYRLIRGVIPPTAKDSGHEGADLSDGRGGDPVRAAGTGLVVMVGGKGWNHGYGRHVVLAHRLTDGTVVYTVYAHLAPQSVTVARGDLVSAGFVIGKVGMTGRATSPHLHFEVRVAEAAGERWENAPVVDPLEFVAARLVAARADSVWSRPYLEWAECAALINPGAPGAGRPSRGEWWRALMAATRHPLATVPAQDESLRATLIELNVLPEYTRGEPQVPLGWSELARDLKRARHQGVRLPWSPVARDPRRQDCRRALGTDSVADVAGTLARHGSEGPDRADMCLALADLAGDPPRRAAGSGRHLAP